MDGVGERILTSTDPLADARAWLAAMRSSMQRMRQQAAPMSSNADSLKKNCKISNSRNVDALPNVSFKPYARPGTLAN